MTTMTSPTSNGKAATAAPNGCADGPIRFPANPTDAAVDDLGCPTTRLLQQLRVLETDDDVAQGVTIKNGTPDSLQVITAGVLSTTKAMTAVTAGGGLAATAAAFIAAIKASELAFRVAFAAAAGVILAATAVALAIVVSADVAGRAAATVAQYDARARIVGAAIGLYGSSGVGRVQPTEQVDDEGASTRNAQLPAALLTSMSAFRTVVSTRSGSTSEVNGIRFCDEGLQIRRADGDWIGVDSIQQFQSVLSGG